jgi:hypothetical protein
LQEKFIFSKFGRILPLNKNPCRFDAGSGKAGASSSHPAKPDVMPRKGLKRKSRRNAYGVFEELERKARPRAAGMRPKNENTKQTQVSSRVCQAPVSD